MGAPRIQNNADLLNAVRNQASLQYQQRIPKTDQANISETLDELSKYRPLFNEFVDALINRIGSVVVRDMSWTNPLAEFKQKKLMFGNAIEEVKLGMIQAREYSANREYLEGEIFGTHKIDAQSAFHSINRQDYYPITVNENLLRRAFLEDGGLSSFVSQMLQAPVTSDNWDEFVLMCNLFSEYERIDGFHKVAVGDLSSLTSDSDTARTALKKIRALSDTLTFPSTKFNPARMPTHTGKEEQVIFATPEFKSALDVDGLAMLFNVDKGEVSQRIITIPKEQFGIDGVQGILTTRDFFMVADTLIENTSQYNPVAMSTNYFLHHHQIISASKFVPAVALTTSQNSEAIVLPKASGINIGTMTVKNADGSAMAESGALPGTNVVVDAPVTGKGAELVAVEYSVSGNTSQRTRVDNSGILTIGVDENGRTLTVKASTVYTDPTAPQTAGKSKTLAVTVDTAKRVPDFPEK